jgi:glycosyltransferase involved in cell wall biosynthesis
LDNGIALPPKPHPELRKRARQRLSLHGGEIAILVVARLIERKNQQLAIRALATIDGETRSRLRLIIVGEGEDYAMLRSLADASGFTDRITLTGNRDDAVELLYGGDVFYMPSLAEGMPLAMIEAMSVALPVISTPWTGVAALLGDAELGTIVPDWSAEASADAILQFIKEPAAFTERAMRAMRSVREKHDIARVAREHEEWYRRLARARGVA